MGEGMISFGTILVGVILGFILGFMMGPSVLVYLPWMVAGALLIMVASIYISPLWYISFPALLFPVGAYAGFVVSVAI